MCDYLKRNIVRNVEIHAVYFFLLFHFVNYVSLFLFFLVATTINIIWYHIYNHFSTGTAIILLIVETSNDWNIHINLKYIGVSCGRRAAVSTLQFFLPTRSFSKYNTFKHSLTRIHNGFTLVNASMNDCVCIGISLCSTFYI